VSYSELAKIAEEEFFDVVLHSQIMAGKLRLHIRLVRNYYFRG